MRRVELDWRLSESTSARAADTELFGAAIARAGIGRLKILYEEGDSGWPDDLGVANTSWERHA